MRDKFYFFPPWRKQFFYSDKLIDLKETASLFYHPYILSSKIVWKLWREVKPFRNLFKVYSENLPSLFNQIVHNYNLNSDYFFQVNTGTRGIEQKMTILAHGLNGQDLFIKAGVSVLAKKMITNEFKTLKWLNGRLETPLVVESSLSEGLGTIATEVLKAKKVSNIKLNEKVFNYIQSIGELKENKIKDGLIYVFSHGDCCPWNFLEKDNNKLVLIDWELSEFLPVGYDLFTYIFQTSFLLDPKKSYHNLILENEYWIINYFSIFQIENYTKYLLAFINLKKEKEKEKGNTPLLAKMLKMEKYFLKAI